MKPCSILLLASAVAAVPTKVIEPRQTGGLGLPGLDALNPEKIMQSIQDFLKSPMVQSMGNMLIDTALAFMPQYKIRKVVELKSDMKASGAKKMEVWYGPIELLLPADAKKAGGIGKMDPNSNMMMGVMSGIPTDITILKAKSDLRFEDGSPANVTTGVYNHHVAYTNVKKSGMTPYVCSNSKDQSGGISPVSVFTGAGEDAGSGQYSSPDGSFPSGYYLGKDAKVLFASEIVNYAKTPKKVFVVSQFDYVQGRPKGFMDSGFAVLSVTQCDGNSPMLRPPEGQKKYNYKSKMLSMTEDGYIVMQRGHLHDGGVNIKMNLNGKEICDSKAIYGLAATDVDGNKWQALNDMSVCDTPIKVAKGDQIQIEAFYDLEKYPARKHAHGGSEGEKGGSSMGGMAGMGDAEEMGIMSFAFASASSAAQ